MREPEFLQPDVVLYMHDQGVREFGGLHGVRDEGVLQRALARAASASTSGAAGSIDVEALAAAYAFGIAREHPFNDGNKRTAWAACALFLTLNGSGIDARAAEIIDTVVAMAAGRIDADRFAAWLRERRRAGA